jgi:aryl-alcohol dehydrogenase
VQIRAAVLEEFGRPLVVQEVELAEPRAGEVLVRLVACGVCHTDLYTASGADPSGYAPTVLGHEGAGVVERVGEGVTKVAPGDHVVMTFDSCGDCANCADGAETYCFDFFAHNFAATRADGSTALRNGDEPIHSNFFGQSSFATHALCHERSVVKVPTDVPLELLGPLACGVQTGAGAVLNALDVTAGKSFAVFGAGSVGLSAVMAAAYAGADPIVAVDIVPERLAFAMTVGATHTIDSSSSNATEELLALTGGGLNFALDTTGLAPVIRSAVEALAPRGTCGILGASATGTEITLDEVHFMSGGRRLMGIVEGESHPDTFIPQLIDMYRNGDFPFDRLVTYYDLDQIDQAFADGEAGRTIKPIVRMG